ncbi:MAG: DUF2345 domain-containing protein [Legionellales bacterium]|nr:DUF2345 domain-containing protein [Legionellales bacterium]
MDSHGWLLFPQNNDAPIPIESLRMKHYAINQLYQCTVQWYSSIPISPNQWLGQPITVRLQNQQGHMGHLHGLVQQITAAHTQSPSLVMLQLVTPLYWLNYSNHAVWGTQSYQQWLTQCLTGCPALQLQLHIPATDQFRFLAMHNENFLDFILACLAQQNYQHTLHQTDTCAQWVITSDPQLPVTPPTIVVDPLDVCYHHDNIQLTVVTEAMNLFPGQFIQLTSHSVLLQSMPQQLWQIRQLQLWYQRDHEQPLQTQLLLTHRPLPFVQQHRPNPSPVLEALVVNSDNSHAELDTQGRYALFFPYAQKTIDQPRFYLAQPYHGDHCGFHSPLTPNSRVLVGFLEDDRQQPFILGTLTDEHHPSSVTAINAYTNQWRSINGHRWSVNNRLHQATMHWVTANEQVQLRLQTTYHSSGIYGLAKQAHIIFQIGKNCQWTAERTLQWYAKHNMHFTVDQRLHFYCKKHLHLAAKYHLRLHAHTTFHIKTDTLTATTHHTYWQSSQQLSIERSNQVKISANNMTWQAAGAIQCHAHKEILIQHGAAQIRISKGGCVTFTASTIHIHGKIV